MDLDYEMNMAIQMDLEKDELHLMDLMQKNMFPSVLTTEINDPTTIKRRPILLNKITIEDFYEYFDKPIVTVAREFGVCTTLFKKICRKSGIRRWPYRKISSLSKTIEAIEESLLHELTPTERTKMLQQLDELSKKRDFVRKNPNSKVALVKPADALSIASRNKKTKNLPSDSEICIQSPHGCIPTDYELYEGLDFPAYSTMYSTNDTFVPSDTDDYNCVVEI